MPSSGMQSLVPIVRTDVSEKYIAHIFRVTRVGELGTLEVTSNVLQLLLTDNVVPSWPISSP
jgi:hypothetical protein